MAAKLVSLWHSMQSVQIRLICYLLLVMLPLMGVSLYAIRQSQALLIRQTSDSVYAALSASMAYIDVIMRSIENISILIASDKEMNDMLSKKESVGNEIFTQLRIMNKVGGISSVNDFISDISIFQKQTGTLVSSSRTGVRQVDLLGEDWYWRAYNLRGISLLVNPRDTPDRFKKVDYLFNKDNILLVRAMGLNRAGYDPNLVSVAIRRQILLESLEQLLEDTDSDVYLLSDTNEMLTSSGTAFSRSWLSDPRRSFLTRSPDGKQQVFVSKVTSASSSWSIVLVQPKSSLYHASKQIQEFIILIIVISVLLAFLISWILYRRITSPLKILSYGMHQIRKGFYNVKLKKDRNDEFGFLMDSFNQMAEQQSHLIRDIYEHQIQRAKTDLKFLQSQINPHFLYNTLDSIYWAARNYEADEISEMVLNLSKFFRLSLTKGKDTFTLEESVAHLQYYMRIQQLRLLDKFAYDVQMAEETKQLPIVKLILQPIVENAIFHGLEKRKDNGGKLTIVCAIEDRRLAVMVKDNGVGMSRERLQYIQRRIASIKEGFTFVNDDANPDMYGIRNVKARLLLYYGNQADLRYESTETEGTVVTVFIPIDRTIQT
ncbi:sensor histidine kinase [Paenibacillus rhizovicinus]|uniref:Sensor histidine kinase n=1 Tax=Paenibacillus rhizovicinus TaxID=2704463 RepID=A0A6C0P5R3_9BACL|nr:sensor histidine kinase [Paenibacillus rhizovicinus]QHW33691.1 sensor histidine kinase [Paenibacillus rhizovicinus]